MVETWVQKGIASDAWVIKLIAHVHYGEKDRSVARTKLKPPRDEENKKKGIGRSITYSGLLLDMVVEGKGPLKFLSVSFPILVPIVCLLIWKHSIKHWFLWPTALLLLRVIYEPQSETRLLTPWRWSSDRQFVKFYIYVLIKTMTADLKNKWIVN